MRVTYPPTSIDVDMTVGDCSGCRFEGLVQNVQVEISADNSAKGYWRCPVCLMDNVTSLPGWDE